MTNTMAFFDMFSTNNYPREALLFINFDPLYVILSLFIAIAGSYAAMTTAPSINHAETRAQRHGWLVLSALALGSAVWAMHFVGMLAMTSDVAISYDPWITALSVIPSILASAFLVRCVSCGNRKRIHHSMICGVVMGFGIGAMHYTGMAAMIMPAHMVYDPVMVGVAIVVAVALATIATIFFRKAGEESQNGSNRHFRRIISATAMGVAISGMHYIAMNGISYYEILNTAQSQDTMNHGILAAAVSVLVVFFVALSIIASVVDVSFRTIRQSQQRYQSVVDMSPAMICTIRQGIITYVNQTGVRLIGASDENRVIGRPFTDFVDPVYATIFEDEEAYEDLSQEPGSIPLMITGIGIAPIHGEMTVGKLSTETGSLYIVEIADISERTNAAKAILEREQHLKGILDGAAEGIVTTDSDGVILSINGAAAQTLHQNEQSSIGRSMEELVGVDFLDTKDRIREAEATRPDGSTFQAEFSLSRTIIGDRQRHIIIFRDITARVQAREKLSYMATHELVTGLPNRATLLDFTNLHALTVKDGGGGMVFFVSLSGLEEHTTVHGYEIGDSILRLMAQRLEKQVSADGMIGCWGGKEFVIVEPDMPSHDTAMEMANRLNDEVCKLLNVDNLQVVLKSNIGISGFPENAKEAERLIRQAGMAMSTGHAENKTTAAFYNTEINQRISDRHAMERELRSALDRQEIQVFYQPKIDLESNTIAGMEALARWIHPTMGMVSPADFIPIAEETGMIVKIGEHILHEACRQTRRWLDQGYNLKIAVNLSTIQLESDGILETIDNVLTDVGLEPKYLELEVTEGALVKDTDAALEILTQIRDRGIDIAIDDFGTGYSSLSYLKRFPVRTLKIDQSFVRNLPHDEGDIAITETIIAMAKSLGLKIVAEGIEDLSQGNFLRERHCELGQGFHYSKPLPVDEFSVYIATNRVNAA